MKRSTVKRTILPNGMRVVSERMPSVRSVALGVWVVVGSRDEPDELAGVCHFLEHMHFKGTAQRDAAEIARSLESVGGSLNAFTGRENTCYHARVLPKHLPLAVDVIADLLGGSLYDSKDVSRERRVIVEEIRDVEDTPSDRVHDLFSKALYDGHPLAHPILGTRGSVRRMRRDYMLAFKKRTHMGGRIVVTAAGRVDHAKLVGEVQRAFDWVSLGASKPRRVRPLPRSGSRATLRDSHLVHLVCGFPALSIAHPDRPALVLLNNALGDGMSSRLFQVVRERNALAYSVYSFLEGYKDSGVWGCYVGSYESNLDRAARAVVGELYSLSREGLDAAELESAREQVRGALVIGLESPVGRLTRLARFELDGRPFVPVSETIAKFEAVTRDDTVRVARRLLRPDRLAWATAGGRINLADRWPVRSR